MTSTRVFINRHSLPIYFAMVFIISWGAILILAGPEGIPATTDQIVVLGMAMLLGPGMASILLIGLCSGWRGFRELLSRLLRWRVGIRWYLVALLMHVSLVATLTIIDPSLTGGGLLTLILVRAIVLWVIVAVVTLSQRRTIERV